MSRIHGLLGLLASSSVLAACLSEAPATDASSQSIVTPNGSNPNGITLNGSNPNGTTLNGSNPNGTTLNGVRLVSATAGGPPLAGVALVGSSWTGQLTDGSSLQMRVDAGAPLAGANLDVWSYAISYVGSDGARRPLCGVDAGGLPILADTVQGTWNYQQGVRGGGAYDAAAPRFTIACRGSSIAKCVEMGYKPWLGLTEELASCVRALRADYCGDGTPYTVTGTLINLYDQAGVQSDDRAWVPEAEWGPGGALCISRHENTRFEQVAGVQPSCYPRTLKQLPTCGAGFTAGATLITELAPR
jgi:hypothetical protein